MVIAEISLCCIAQRLATPLAVSADEENDWRLSVARTLVHDIVTERLKGGGLVQVDNALGPRFGAGALWVVRPVAYDHPPSAVLDVLQVQAQHLTRS